LLFALFLASLPAHAHSDEVEHVDVPVDNYIVYDGRSSDLAQHFYPR
jgi:hypothetical protein